MKRALLVHVVMVQVRQVLRVLLLLLLLLSVSVLVRTSELLLHARIAKVRRSGRHLQAHKLRLLRRRARSRRVGGRERRGQLVWCKSVGGLQLLLLELFLASVVVVVVLIVVLAVVLAVVEAEGEGEVVRVGWLIVAGAGG